MFTTKRFRSDYFKRMSDKSSMQRLKAVVYIQDFYRHWKWGQAVKETLQIIGPQAGLVRQSGYDAPFPFHYRYVNAQPAWCCPGKNRDMFHLTKENIVDKFVENRLKQMGKYPLTLEKARRNLASIKIQRCWQTFVEQRGGRHDPNDVVILFQRRWKDYKIRNGSYFKLTSRCIGDKCDDRVYQHQENKIWSINNPDAPCSLLTEESLSYPMDHTKYIIKILV